MRPKTHYLEHHADAVALTRLNPLHAQTWREEGLMGVNKRAGPKTHGANCVLRLLQRYVIGLQMRWRDRAKSGQWTARGMSSM
eukprot:15477553-Alexandrium_andersonii.AAC.1